MNIKWNKVDMLVGYYHFNFGYKWLEIKIKIKQILNIISIEMDLHGMDITKIEMVFKIEI